MVAVIAFHFCFLVVQLNLCTPVAKQWDPAITDGNCLTAVPFYTSMASLTILFDVIIMILPFPVLITTQLPTKKKLILFGLFGLGTFITIIQIIRIQTIHALQNYLDSSMLIMWSMVENNLGVTIASIPALSPLIRTWREKTKGSSNGQPSGGSYALGSLGNKDGRVRLASQNDKGLRGGEEGKIMTHTSIKIGSFKHGDNSSEEYIIAGQDKEGIRATTEVVVERDDGNSQYGGNPFTDPRTGIAK